MGAKDSLSTRLPRKRWVLLSLHRFGALTGQSRGVARLTSLASAAVLGPAWGESKTMLWWAGLCVASLLNVWMWLAAVRVGLPDTTYKSWQLVLSGVYVAVCAFRSAFPRVDLERLCLWDTPLSAIFIGRAVATLAEMCFAVQCTLFLSKLSEITRVASLDTLSVGIVPVIVIAQLSCWYAVITLNHLGHVVEEILWTFIVALLAVGCASSCLHTHGVLRITPRARCGSFVASISASGPENDQPKTQKAPRSATAASTNGSKSEYPFAPEVGYVTTTGRIHDGRVAISGRKNTSVPSSPGKRTSVVVACNVNVWPS